MLVREKKLCDGVCWGVSHTPYVGECGTLQMGKINGRMPFALTGGKCDLLQPYHMGRLFHFGATVPFWGDRTILGRPQGSPLRAAYTVR